MDPSDLEGMSPEQIEQLIALGIIPEQQDQLNQQYASADALRNKATPEMRGNGRVMVAANPLEPIGVGMQRYAGQRDAKRIQEQQDALRRQQVQGRTDFLKQWLGPPRPQSIRGPLPQIPMGNVPPPKPMSF